MKISESSIPCLLRVVLCLTVAVLPSSVSASEYCCSNNYKQCLESSWCNAKADNCEGPCGGQWIEIPDTTCTPRWDGCGSSERYQKGPCCEGLMCTGNGWGSCQPAPTCCTLDKYQTCSNDSHCSANPEHCEIDCDGKWVHLYGVNPTMPSPPDGEDNPGPSPSTDAPTSKPTKDPTKAPTDAPTKSPTKAPTDAPTKAPTKAPTPSPTKAPTDAPTTSPTPVPTSRDDTGSPTSSPVTEVPTNSPTKAPTDAPTAAPTKKPTKEPTKSPTDWPAETPTVPPTLHPTDRSPTDYPTKSPTLSPTDSPDIVIPSGPYITAEEANELITIPDPTEPTNLDDETQTNCPHLAAGLLDWHDAATWDGVSVPWLSGDVVLPTNAVVVIRESVGHSHGTVTIPSSSELILAEGVDFEVAGMEVFGKFTVGSETCRVLTPTTITLHGSRPFDVVQNPPAPLVKGIAVNGGTLNLHGKRYFRTWTRLSKSVEIGEDVILLQHQVNWEAGQEIVLVTTAMKDSREWHENEIAVVHSVVLNPVEGVGAAVQLTTGVNYRHAANSNWQGEVGLLTRTIKVQGNTDSEPTDPDTGCTGRNNWGNSDRPCGNQMITGYGGHMIVYNGGRGYVKGVELYRMGQTNVMGRYPMHFHLLGECPDCYFKDSSVHRSYYRCISIHGSHYTTVSENVAYDVTGFCYYLEDGVEHDNRIDFNLGAHIHIMLDQDPPPYGGGQTIDIVQQSDTLLLPADITASAFYITNVNNYVRGNAASGGWAGFAFPKLPTPLGPHRYEDVVPLEAPVLEIDGNTAHSTAWWWYHSAAFYFGGLLEYVDDNSDQLQYNAGRSLGSPSRSPENGAFVLTNTKAFLAAGVGLGSWDGKFDIHNYECIDCGMAMEALSGGFWVNNMLAVCRSGTPMQFPPGGLATASKGGGFKWYDTNQEHIITHATFRNCGYRSDEYNQYNSSPTRGCGDDPHTGCTTGSSAWGMLTHSDQFVPEVMQATKGIVFEDCGRRFKSNDYRSNPPFSSVSGRVQNWLDADGTITGLGERSAAGSGLADAGMWWNIDDQAVYDPQGPLWFFSLESGPSRGLGHFKMQWDTALHNQIGSTQCGNGPTSIPCQPVGYIKHLGPRFQNDLGLPVTANADIAGPVGGFGWKLELNNGAPKTVTFSHVEVDPTTPLLLSIAYPLGTTLSVSAHAASWCNPDREEFKCSANFVPVNSIEEVRNRPTGDGYYVDPATGVVTFRIVQTPQNFVGRPDFWIPQWDDTGRPWGSDWTIDRFERSGVRLPKMGFQNHYLLSADCPSADGVYCDDKNLHDYQPQVCANGQTQTAYDTCV